MKIIAIFNNKGGVGKTTLVYHLAWMFHELSVRTVALDLDPQANLTAAFLPGETLEQLWADGDRRRTIYHVVEPFVEEAAEERTVPLEDIADGLSLVPGDLALSRFEDRLAEVWPKCLDGKSAAFRATAAFYSAATQAGRRKGAAVALVDVGPSLGALNRAAIIASDALVLPLAADLFSLQALSNLGPTVERWRTEWQRRLAVAPQGLALPAGRIEPAGYVVLQHAAKKESEPVKAYARWMAGIPATYHREILKDDLEPPTPDRDPACLASLKHYRSLMPLAQDARKPIFLLRSADGAIGGHAAAVTSCYRDFRGLAWRILEAVGLPSEQG